MCLTRSSIDYNFEFGQKTFKSNPSTSTIEFFESRLYTIKVNEAKTELCLFYKHETALIRININGKMVDYKTNINILGVLFDSKLQWSDHVAKTLLKKSTLCSKID